MKEVVIFTVVVALVAGLFAWAIIAEANTPKVEGIVISCEEGRVVENGGAKVMATYSFATGKTTQALMYGSLANQKTQKYTVVVEYEGNQYTITTSKKYEVGETILFKLPKN